MGTESRLRWLNETAPRPRPSPISAVTSATLNNLVRSHGQPHITPDIRIYVIQRRIRSASVASTENQVARTPGARGILFFAQLMSEMLTPTTFDSFRVFSLDTLARLREANQLIRDVKRGRVPRATLDPIFLELMWSFEKDAAASSLIQPEASFLVRITRDKSCRIDEVSSHCTFLEKKLSATYRSRLELLILDNVDNPSKKTLVRRMSGFYCSNLINSGYARRHVLDILNSTFFEANVKRMGKATLKRFFRTLT